MRDRKIILKALIDKWDLLNISDRPPKEPIQLLTEEECIVYVEDSWGPVIPYPPVDHGNGEKNHGYRKIKGNKDAIASIPEVVNFPEYKDFLQAVNSSDSIIESVGCEKGFRPVDDHSTIKVNLGSYIDIIFSDYELNNDPKNILHMAAVFVEALHGSAVWWSKAEFGVQRLKKLYMCDKPWGLMLRIQGYGRMEEEARMSWAASLKKLSESIQNIKI